MAVSPSIANDDICKKMSAKEIPWFNGYLENHSISNSTEMIQIFNLLQTEFGDLAIPPETLLERKNIHFESTGRDVFPSLRRFVEYPRYIPKLQPKVREGRPLLSLTDLRNYLSQISEPTPAMILDAIFTVKRNLRLWKMVKDPSRLLYRWATSSGARYAGKPMRAASFSYPELAEVGLDRSLLSFWSFEKPNGTYESHPGAGQPVLLSVSVEELEKNGVIFFDNGEQGALMFADLKP